MSAFNTFTTFIKFECFKNSESVKCNIFLKSFAFVLIERQLGYLNVVYSNNNQVRKNKLTETKIIPRSKILFYNEIRNSNSNLIIL